MRIAYVVADHGIPVFGTKGASIHVREMVNAFAALGHRVTLVVARRGEADAAVEAEIVKVRPPPLSTTEGDKTVRKEKTSMAVDEEILRTLSRLHEAEPFDLVYERYTLFGTASVRFQKRFGVPAVLEVNAPLVQEQSRFRKLHHRAEAEANEEYMFRQAALVVTVSDAVKDYVIRRGAEPARVRTLPNAVDPKRFHPRVEPIPAPWTGKGPVIGFSGSLKPWHGLEHLLEAFRILAMDLPDARLVIIGDGPMKPWIEGYVHGAELKDRVWITGWVSHDTLPRILKTLDMAAAPYPPMDDFYFSPMKLFEYLALGIPVVASAIGQLDALLVEGRNALLVPPGDSAALAAALKRLANDPDLRGRLSAAAADSMQHRTWYDNARKVLEWIPSHP